MTPLHTARHFERRKLSTGSFGRRQTVKELTAVFQHADQGLVLADLSGKILQVNRRLAELLGYDQSELVGKHFAEITCQADVRKDLDLFLQLAGGRRNAYRLEKRYVHKTGRLVMTLLRASAIRDARGVVRYLLGQVQEITRGQQFQADLYESLVRHSDNVIYICSLEGIILSWNPAAERVLGYHEQEIIGRHISLLFPDEGDLQSSSYLERVRQGESIQQETKRKSKQGRLVDLSITISPVKNDTGQVVGTATIARDITEQVAVQHDLARLDRLALVGEMAASIGHELRNPMTTVRGYLQLLARQPQLVPYADEMQLMIDELDRMNDIISEFLALARDKRVNLIRGDLNQLIRSLLPLIEAEGMLQGKAVKAELCDLPPLLLDPKEIRQLLLNLVQNSFDAMQPGRQVTIRTTLQEQHALLEIIDQGSGIPAQYLNKLGTPFFSTKEGGTGLGLSICYSIAARHGAKVEVESDQIGTAFRILFPLPMK